jgi:hypothetical protein
MAVLACGGSPQAVCVQPKAERWREDSAQVHITTIDRLETDVATENTLTRDKLYLDLPLLVLHI